MPVGSEACLLCCSIDGGVRGAHWGTQYTTSAAQPPRLSSTRETPGLSHRRLATESVVMLFCWGIGTCMEAGPLATAFNAGRGFHWTWPASRPSRRCPDGRAICFGAMPSKSIHAVREFLETHSAPWHEYAFSHMDTRRDCRCSAICM